MESKQSEEIPANKDTRIENEEVESGEQGVQESTNSNPLEIAEPEATASVKRTHSTEDEGTPEESRKRRMIDGDDSSITSRGSPKSIESEDEGVESVGSPGPEVSPIKFHPRVACKRKLWFKEDAANNTAQASTSHQGQTASDQSDSQHFSDLATNNSYQLYLDIRKQINKKRKGLFPVQPKPPQGFKDYLMIRCSYVLASNATNRVPSPSTNPPASVAPLMKDLFIAQEQERHRLLMQHVIEKEKLVLSVEQEILRVHGCAARTLANQSLPFSACTFLRDEEVYSAITPEQEERDRNARSRYNRRLFLSWFKDIDDKWEKIKESMILRHHNEAESLYVTQKMDWGWKLKEVGLCEFKLKPTFDDSHVPMVRVSDDFDLLPA